MPETQQRESWQTAPITDARGRSVAQLDPVVLHLMRRHDAIEPETLATIAHEVGLGLTRTNRALLIFTILGSVCLVIAITILLLRLRSGTIGLGRFVGSLLPYCGVWIAPFGLWRGTRFVRSRSITRIMLAHRRCPHCGYDLRDLPAEQTDGATLCPECGCAWAIDAGT